MQKLSIPLTEKNWKRLILFPPPQKIHSHLAIIYHHPEKGQIKKLTRSIMDTADIISSSCLVNNSVYQGHHLLAIATRANVYPLHNAASLHIATGHQKGRLEKLMISSPLLPPPSARIISNSELINCSNPSLETVFSRKSN